MVRSKQYIRLACRIRTSYVFYKYQTPYEIAFGQQPRLDDHAWKSIEARIKEKHGQEIILEEDLSDDIIDMMKEMDQVGSELVDGGNTEIINEDDATAACNVVTTATDTNDCRIRDEEDTRPDFNIDHEELVDVNEPLLSDVCMDPDSTEIDQHTQIREEAQEAYLSNVHTRAPRDNQKFIPSCPASRTFLSRPVLSRLILFLQSRPAPTSRTVFSRPVFSLPVLSRPT